MEPPFSETAFAFGVAHELYNVFRGYAFTSPVFPSLMDERDLGWDANFDIQGLSVFLQFKLADALTTNRAKYWSVCGQPYFRLLLYPRSKSPQHNRLVSLSKTERFVYYIAPLFHTYSEFSTHFVKNQILANTRWVPLSGMTMVRGKKGHCITYSRGGPSLLHSQPVPIETISGEIFLADVVGHLNSKSARINLGYLRRLWSAVNEIIGTDMLKGEEELAPDRVFGSESPNELVRDLRMALRSYFGVEWMVFSRDSSNSTKGHLQSRIL